SFRGLIGPDHDGSDQPVVIFCWGRRPSRLLWFRHLLTPCGEGVVIRRPRPCFVFGPQRRGTRW
ncbi:hypothetical protein MGG_15710, partial [Pyricularia oryzae 70-15]